MGITRKTKKLYILDTDLGTKGYLYRILDVQTLDGGVSGVGEEIYFDENQIKDAILKSETIDWSNIEQTEPEYEKDKLAKFLDGLLSIATNEGKVKVYFG